MNIPTQFERAVTLMNQWTNLNQGATNTELHELANCLRLVNTEVNEVIYRRGDVFVVPTKAMAPFQRAVRLMKKWTQHSNNLTTEELSNLGQALRDMHLDVVVALINREKDVAAYA
jgi:hypothetical protein